MYWKMHFTYGEQFSELSSGLQLIGGVGGRYFYNQIWQFLQLKVRSDKSIERDLSRLKYLLLDGSIDGFVLWEGDGSQISLLCDIVHLLVLSNRDGKLLSLLSCIFSI